MRTYVDESRFLYASDITTDDGYLNTVVVHWATHAIDVTAIAKVAAFQEVRTEASEIWFVYPADIQADHDSVRALDEFAERTRVESDLNFRFFSVDGSGAWTETSSVNNHDPIPVNPVVVDDVIQDGLRQIFRDSDALVTASAGYHFARSLRRHSERLMMASQAVARAQHAGFVAMALLSRTEIGPDARLFADTAGIAPALHALADLVRRLRGSGAGARAAGSTVAKTDILVDSFGSYDGFEEHLRVRDDRDWVFISSSTSGSLARKLILGDEAHQKQPQATADRVITLYYLAKDVPKADSGLVLCDLTNRSPNPAPSVRDARMSPFVSYTLEDDGVCELCALGSRPIELAGDSFFPSPDSLRLRMPGLKDRPLKADPHRLDRTLWPQFDDSPYFSDLFGLDAIRATRTFERETRPYDVSTRIGHLLDGKPEHRVVEKRLKDEIKKLLAKSGPVSVVLALPDSDSWALSAYLAAELIKGPISEPVRGLFVGKSLAQVTGDRDAILAQAPAKSTVLVCGGVVGSGRMLLGFNRDLRSLPDSVETKYFIGVVHPESGSTWQIFQNSIARRSTNGTSGMAHVWKLPREPRTPGAPDTWERERLTLGEVESHLKNKKRYDLQRPIQRRIQELALLEPDQLFVSASFESDDEHPMRPVNAKFVLWPFEWSHDPRATKGGAVPTQSEILATVGHFLYESRRLNPSISHDGATVLRHGFALNPAVFDRFNEPQLQASILRSAEPGELFYETDLDSSRAMADIIRHALENSHLEGGEASYEFLLSLADGIVHPSGPGMRLHRKALRTILDHPTARGAELSQPLVGALQEFLRSRVAPAKTVKGRAPRKPAA